MSNELKCPRCGGRLVYWGATGALLKCSQCSFGWGEEELWQELIRTRKALETVMKDNKNLEKEIGNLKDNAKQLGLALTTIDNIVGVIVRAGYIRKAEQKDK